MITKFPRNEKGNYNLKVTDSHGHSFIMLVGGNLDLYWLPENHKQNRVFEIDSNDKFTFNVFEQLFKAVKTNDDKYHPILIGNTITYISEEWTEEESNLLKITKQENKFVIEFIKNENEKAWQIPHRGCSICFCNSGSRVPKVESLFMQLFNYLAYYCDSIKLESASENHPIF